MRFNLLQEHPEGNHRILAVSGQIHPVQEPQSGIDSRSDSSSHCRFNSLSDRIAYRRRCLSGRIIQRCHYRICRFTFGAHRILHPLYLRDPSQAHDYANLVVFGDCLLNNPTWRTAQGDTFPGTICKLSLKLFLVLVANSDADSFKMFSR